MANWEPQHPPRTSSRFPAPGIFVNVEFGVSFSPEDRPHTASMKYTSRNMAERIQRRDDEQRLWQQHPAILMPGYGYDSERHSRHHQQHRRPRRLGVRNRDQHERGNSAPPAIPEREPISPMSPISAIQHTSSMPLDGTDRPLPPVPSRFRLGEDDLPWSVPPWYRPAEPEFASPTVVGIESEDQRSEDPQRVRDLETLHQAMMTVDSLDHDGWETWTWDSVGDMPRGPRSIGWAVSSEAGPSSPPPPPPYVVSQWEQAFARGVARPRSSG